MSVIPLSLCRFTSADAELHKDVEGVVEGFCHTLAPLLESPAWHADAPGQRLEAAAALLSPLLELWDGVCCLYAHTAKPSTWLNVLLKALKAAGPEARAQAADAARVRHGCCGVAGSVKALGVSSRALAVHAVAVCLHRVRGRLRYAVTIGTGQLASDAEGGAHVGAAEAGSPEAAVCHCRGGGLWQGQQAAQKLTCHVGMPFTFGISY